MKMLTDHSECHPNLPTFAELNAFVDEPTAMEMDPTNESFALNTTLAAVVTSTPTCTPSDGGVPAKLKRPARGKSKVIQSATA